MAKGKYKFVNNHPYERLRERTNRPISTAKINEALSKNNCTFAKRCSNTRSIVYLKIDGIPLKLVIARHLNKVITVLPFNYPYELDYVTVELEDSMYKIKIFPDCYIETENSRLMTEFYKKENNEWIPIKKKKYPFEFVFNLVWNYYQECFCNKKDMEELICL